MSDKNTNKLRPFNLEDALSGAKICDWYGVSIHSLASPVPDRDGEFIVWSDHEGGLIEFKDKRSLRMAPLFWVEGDPVYRGDVLYSTVSHYKGEERTVTGCEGDIVSTVERGDRTCTASDLTWVKAKKRFHTYLHLYDDGTSCVHDKPISDTIAIRVLHHEWEA